MSVPNGVHSRPIDKQAYLDRLRELMEMPYDEYLRTAEWAEMRSRAIARADGRCQLCNGEEGLQVHHRTYERRGNESPMDLTVLCRACHGRFHGIEEAVPPVWSLQDPDDKWRWVTVSAECIAKKIPPSKGKGDTTGDLFSLEVRSWEGSVLIAWIGLSLEGGNLNVRHLNTARNASSPATYILEWKPTAS